MWNCFAPALRRALRSPARVAAATVCLVLGASVMVPVTADAAPAPAPVTFGIGTATAGKADSRGQLNYSVSPGARLADQVVVVNHSGVPLTLSVYASDATNGVGGAITYQPKANPGTGSRTWISLHLPGGGSSLRVPARQSILVPIDVAVPMDATPGDHVVGIGADLTARAVTTNGKSFAFEQAVALPTHFRVSGEFVPRLAVEHFNAVFHGSANPLGTGHTTISYTVHNTGNVTLGAAQRTTVSTLFGENGPTTRLPAVPDLLPGNSYSVRLDVPGTYPAFVLTVRVRLTPKAADLLVGTPIPVVDTSTALLAVPWPLLGVLVLLAALAFGLRLRRGRAPSARHQRANRRGSGSAALGEA